MKPKPKKPAAKAKPAQKATTREPRQLALTDFIPDDRNANKGTERGNGLLHESLERLGAGRSILADKNGRIIAGNKTHEAAVALGLKAVQVEVDGDTLVVVRRKDLDIDSPQGRELAIADNRVGEINLNWDPDILAEFKEAGVGVGNYFFDRELEKMARESGSTKPEEEAAPPVEPEAKTVSRLGDVWTLKAHRIMCGDSRDVEHVAVLMAGKIATLLHADPPYGMGKEAAGVANDNLYGDKLDAFQMGWWRAFRPHLAPNGSAYIWGNAPGLWRLWYRALESSEPLSLRNEIVWDKKTIAGMGSDELGQFPEATERCLFFQIGRHIFAVNQTKEDYWRGWDPIRLWMVGEKDRMKWKASDVKRLTGNHMHGHWFGESQWCFISEDNYEKLQVAADGKAFTRAYADLRREYEGLQAIFNGEVRDPRFKEFAAGRPYFDNAHEVMRDVWEFGRVIGEERGGHATPKPIDMMERVVKSSSRSGDVIVEPFGGTGPTMMAADRNGRACYSMELEPLYVDYMIERWEKATGEVARHVDGRTFAEVRAARESGAAPEEEAPASAGRAVVLQ